CLAGGTCFRMPWTRRSASLRSTVDEVDKFPAPFLPADAGTISGVICRRVRELRGRDHVIFFLHKMLREDSVELDPQAVLVPILKDTGALAIFGRSGAEHVGEPRRHHRGDRIDVVRLNRLTQPTDERLEINIRIFFVRRMLGGFSRFFGVFLWIGRWAGGE